MLRRNFILVIVSVLFVGLFQGCMPTTTPFAPKQVKPDKALVYVYRPESIVARGSMWGIKVNGKIVTKNFINNGYIPIYIDAGDAELELFYQQTLFNKLVFDDITLRDLKAGEVYYVKAFMEFAGSPHFELKNSDVGAREISETNYYDYTEKK